MKPVPVIWNLRIVCNLGFVIWNFLKYGSVHASHEEDSIAWGMDLAKGKSSGAGGHSPICSRGVRFVNEIKRFRLLLPSLNGQNALGDLKMKRHSR